MRRMLLILLLAAMAAMLLAACDLGGPRGIVRIGAKSFAEQAVLAETMAHLLEQAGHAATVIECGDSYECAQALRGGRIDLMAEYTGTGLVSYRARLLRQQVSLDELNRLYEPLGMEWLHPLGFENGYAVVMPTSRARTLGIRSLSDLADLESGVRFAVSPEFRRRPADGLPALLQRYGLRLRGEAMLIEEPEARLRALLADRADVAVVHETDGVLRDLAMTRLRDDLGFFPAYRAVIVGRTALRAERPAVLEALAPLRDRISASTMQQLNFEVQVQGWRPSAAAARYLHETGLLEGTRGVFGRQPEIVLASDPREGYASLRPLALSAVRAAFPGQTVRVESTDDPIAAVWRGQARLAMVSAEHFFAQDTPAGPGAESEEVRVEAAAVVARQYLHVIRHRHDSPFWGPLDGRLGVPPRGSSATRAVRAVLEAAGHRPDEYHPVETLVQRLRDNELAAALVMAAPGDPRIARALEAHDLVLHPVPALQGELPAYLRAARIPPDTYPGQVSAVESVGMQVVIAGPTPAEFTGLLPGGPGSAVRGRAPALTLEEAQHLASALQVPEPPEPALPSVWRRATFGQRHEETQAFWGSAVDTLLNVAAVVLLVWAAALVLRRRA